MASWLLSGWGQFRQHVILRSVADCEKVCRRLLSVLGRWKVLLHLPQRITRGLGRTKGAVMPSLEESLLLPYVQVLGSSSPEAEPGTLREGD